MPHEELPQDAQLSVGTDLVEVPEQPDDLQAMLGIEAKVDDGELTPDDLLAKVVTSPEDYHVALLPHIGNFLVKNGLADQVAEHSQLFQPTSPESQPLQAIAEHQPERTIIEINHILRSKENDVPKLTTSDADKLIDIGRDHLVIPNLDKFQGLDYQATANKLINIGRGFDVADNLDKFQGLDYQATANKLIDSDDYVSLIRNLDKFQGLDYQATADKIFYAGQGVIVPDFLSIFHFSPYNR